MKREQDRPSGFNPRLGEVPPCGRTSRRKKGNKTQKEKIDVKLLVGTKPTMGAGKSLVRGSDN